jgi:hypothetical protein
MISVFRHDDRLQFHCKGNFDVEQSRRAARIAQRYRMDQLELDRYWYVFEVIYPENRFPAGLCITDYGDREDLVLTCMRDRRTNRMLSFADSIREAQRVGLPHPRVFPGTLDEALSLTDQPQEALQAEGYVARFSNGKYLKIKYPAYLRVLKHANDLNANRFVKRYFRAEQHEQEGMLSTLPADFRRVAEKQLDAHRAIAERGRAYCDRVGRLHRAALPQYVLDEVPSDFQRGVFATSRGQDVDQLIQKLAKRIYYGQLSLPDRDTDM